MPKPVAQAAKNADQRNIGSKATNGAIASKPAEEARPYSRGKAGPGPGGGEGERVIEASPLYKENPPPAYPGAAIRRGYSGTVLLKVLVTAEGRVRDLQIIQSSGYPMLDKAALKAVNSWVFVPGKKGAAPIETWVNVPVVFQLKS